MSQREGLNRRAFLRNAGMTALVGAVATGPPEAMAAARPPTLTQRQVRLRHPLQPVRHRQRQVRPADSHLRQGHIQVGMGIADMDFRAAPCITRALRRACSTRTGATSISTKPTTR